VDRVKLIISIIECRESDGGCNYEYEKALTRGPNGQNCLEAFFPLHDEDEMLPVLRKVIDVYTMPWNIPTDELKDYFGEKIGLYFKWAAHYTSWMSMAAVVGMITFVFSTGLFETLGKEYTMQGAWGEDDENPRGVYRATGLWGAKVDHVLVPVFCVFMSFWSVLYFESWKSTQVTMAQRWGMHGSEDEQQDRPTFIQNPENVEINSPVDGSPMFYFPPALSAHRKNMGMLMTSTFVVITMIGVFSTFMLKGIMTDQNRDYFPYFVVPPSIAFWTADTKLQYGALGSKTTLVGGFPYGSIVATGWNSVQILLLDGIFSPIAYRYNVWENHRVNTEFEDALIMKNFLFGFINKFGALIYIAFLKVPFVARTLWPILDAMADGESVDPNTELYDGAAELPWSCGIGMNKDTCLMEIHQQLVAIFGINMIVTNVVKVMIPFLMEIGMTEEEQEEKDDVDAEFEKADASAAGPIKRMRSKVECEFDLEEFPLIEGPFDSYKELVFQFGYATLFAAAYPLAPLLSFMSNYVDIRSDLYSIGYENRRPIPANAEDIGSWEGILDTMGTAAIISNSALVCLTGEFMDGYDWMTRLLSFLAMEHGLMMMKVAISVGSPDMPEEVEMQLGRQEFIVSKLIDDREDDQDPPLEEAEDPIHAAIEVFQTDEDAVLKLEVEEQVRADLKRRAKAGAPDDESAGGGPAEETKDD